MSSLVNPYEVTYAGGDTPVLSGPSWSFVLSTGLFWDDVTHGVVQASAAVPFGGYSFEKFLALRLDYRDIAISYLDSFELWLEGTVPTRTTLRYGFIKEPTRNPRNTTSDIAVQNFGSIDYSSRIGWPAEHALTAVGDLTWCLVLQLWADAEIEDDPLAGAWPGSSNPLTIHFKFREV
jgi:hypothetical protein